MTAVARTAAAALFAIVAPFRGRYGAASGFAPALDRVATISVATTTTTRTTTTTTRTRTRTRSHEFGQLAPTFPFAVRLLSPVVHAATLTDRGCLVTRWFSSGKAPEVEDDDDNSDSMSTTWSEGAWEEETNEDDANSEEGEQGEEEDDSDDDFASEDEENNNVLYDEFLRWSKQLSSTVESLERKKSSLAKELKKAETVEDTVHRAQLLTSNMYLFTPGVRSATVHDWETEETLELTLDDAYDSASAEADALFQQIRKLKRGSTVVQSLLQETTYALETLQETELDLNACCVADSDGNTRTIRDENMFRLIQDRLIRSSRTTGFSAPKDTDDAGNIRKQKSSRTSTTTSPTKKPALGTPASNIRKLVSPGGCLVLVGRNRRGNEYLTFNVARGDDIWMHARGCPGAHVLIQQRRGSPPVTPACIQFAADLAIFYSDARSESSFDVTSAEPKHLQKPRGAPLGAVKLRQELAVHTGYPHQAVEAATGGDGESVADSEQYRFRDKAKHRKKTKEIAQQERTKRKAKIQEKRKRKNT